VDDEELSVIFLPLIRLVLSRVGELDLDPSPDRTRTTGALSAGGEPSEPWESDNGPSDELPCPESDLALLLPRNLGM